MTAITGFGPVSCRYFALAVASFCLLYPVRVSSTIVVINADETTNDTIDDSPANFGMSLVDLTMLGAIYDTNASDLGCNAETIPPAPLSPPFNDSRLTWFLILQRGNCTFAQKAINAQMAGYDALIVRNEQNRPDRSSLICGSPFPCDNITIYVTMVSYIDGRDLASLYKYSNNFTISISGQPSETYLYYILPFIVVVGVVLLVVVAFFVFRAIRDCRQARKARLTRWSLRKIPTKKFQKGTDQYDCCSICLDDFVDGDKLRILPCGHAYHQKCIDPWLLNNRRNCPVCKRKVRIPGEQDSDDEEANRSQTPARAQSQISGGGHPIGINSEEHDDGSAMAIGEGRQHAESMGSNDGAPLIRREASTGMNCCIPRSYRSTDSLAASSSAIATTPGVNVAVTASSLPTSVIMPSSSRLSSDIGIVSPQSQLASSMVEHHHQAHPSTMRPQSRQSETETDTSSLSGTEFDQSQNNASSRTHETLNDQEMNATAVTSSSSSSSSDSEDDNEVVAREDSVVVQVVGHSSPRRNNDNFENSNISDDHSGAV